jgi:ClpP class serine protease
VIDNRLPFIAQKFINSPLAIAPAQAEMLVHALSGQLGAAQSGATRVNRGPLVARSSAPTMRRVARTYTVLNEVAIIPVYGTLIHKSGSLEPIGGMTGYDGIRQNFLAALGDPTVKAIALDMDSDGGEVDGLLDLADVIYRARKDKPIWAILSYKAYSGAYVLASAASRIIVPRTGGTGSIGVIVIHVDMSRALREGGLAVTLIHYGARKADFTETAPLTREAFRRAQADVDAMGTMMDDVVARNRGVAASKIKGLQAGTFMGARSVAAGLADAVMAPDAGMRELVNAVRQSRRRALPPPAESSKRSKEKRIRFSFEHLRRLGRP